MKARINNTHELILERKGKQVFVNEKELLFDLQEIRKGTFNLIVNNKSIEVELVDADTKNKLYKLIVNNKVFTISLKDKLDDLLHQLGMDNSSATKVNNLKAPMPGLVLEIRVAEGEKINKGDTLVVLEAMKMENALKAESDATVKKINVKKGNTVEKNQVLIHLE